MIQVSEKYKYTLPENLITQLINVYMICNVPDWSQFQGQNVPFTYSEISTKMIYRKYFQASDKNNNWIIMLDEMLLIL